MSRFRFKKSTYYSLLVILISLLSSGCVNDSIIFASDISDIINKIETQMSEIDYKKYIDIDFEGSSLLYNHTTVQQSRDENFCSIIYNVTLKNISNDNIDINLKLFLPKELTARLVYGDTTLGPRKKSVELKPGEKINISFGTLVKHYSKLSEEEKFIFNKFKNTLYLELLINGKKAYIKLEA